MPGRGPESYAAENKTRRMIPAFFEARGFGVTNDSFDPDKKRQTQTLDAKDPTGHSIRIRVKVCWPSRKPTAEKRPGYACQLTGMIKDGDGGGAVKRYVERARKKQITHFAFIVREGEEITHAALLPISELAPIWSTQRRAYGALIKRGRHGKRKRNPADNGSSSTLGWSTRKPKKPWTYSGIAQTSKISRIFPVKSSPGTQVTSRFSKAVKMAPRRRSQVRNKIQRLPSTIHSMTFLASIRRCSEATGPLWFKPNAPM